MGTDAQDNIVALQIQGGELTPVLNVPHPNLTILELKKKIQEETGVAVSRQTLWCEVEMEDSLTMADYGLETHCSVRLYADPLPEHVTFSVRVQVWSQRHYISHYYDVKETDTVLDLKKKIVEKDYPKALIQEMQMYVWLVPTEMKDDQPLSKYYVHDGSILAVNIKKKMNGSESV